ncbi:MAG: C10 family peptidase [Candidatus Zixiibacteriota bacterium]
MNYNLKRLFYLFPLTFFLVICLTSISIAERATNDEMELVCKNWVNLITFQKGDWAGSDDPKISDIIEIVVNDTIVGHYYEIDPTGYVIVPVLKEMVPVKFYSDENHLDWTELDGPTKLFKEMLIGLIRDFIMVHGSIDAVPTDKDEILFDPGQKLYWNKYLVPEDEFTRSLSSVDKSTNEVGPLLTSSWHQGAPYNYDCPTGDGGQCVVGCVATAAAQILAYHKWPLEGTSQHIYGWTGDNSCEGSSTGAALYADYRDAYDWDNIPDNCNGGCTAEEMTALAELNYEVGVAFNMDYGVCGSGAYTDDAADVFPAYFRYKDSIIIYYRSGTGLSTYSDVIRTEIENNRPCQYRISGHSIVCDGWRMNDILHQYHMNYGWGGSNNYWYTMDNLYCPWDGCSYNVEFVVTNIKPDRGVSFTADTSWGYAPLTVGFEGYSELAVDQWNWDFGDGDHSSDQMPSHTYTDAGQFDVSLQISSGADIRSYSASNYITILADTLLAVSAMGDPGETIEVVINCINTLPVRKFKIPVHYTGDLNLTMTGFSAEGCRTEYFDIVKKVSSNTLEKVAVFSMYNNTGTPDLAVGSGPVLKLYFSIPAGATTSQTAQISYEDYSTHELMFTTPYIDYPPIPVGGNMTLTYICGDCNHDMNINILDITTLINYLYKDGNPPAPEKSGDVNNSGNCNILDITYIINYLYKNGPSPNCL